MGKCLGNKAPITGGSAGVIVRSHTVLFDMVLGSFKTSLAVWTGFTGGSPFHRDITASSAREWEFDSYFAESAHLSINCQPKGAITGFGFVQRALAGVCHCTISICC